MAKTRIITIAKTRVRDIKYEDYDDEETQKKLKKGK